MTTKQASKVVGYFAYLSKLEVCCSKNGCVIAGSSEVMMAHMRALDVSNPEGYTIRKTRFGEIVRGMQRGGAYAFDAESYPRYRALAKEAGWPLGPDEDFTAAHARGDRFLIVQPAFG